MEAIGGLVDSTAVVEERRGWWGVLGEIVPEFCWTMTEETV